MKKIRGLAALLLTICLLFTLTGCQKEEGKEAEQPAQTMEVSVTNPGEVEQGNVEDSGKSTDATGQEPDSKADNKDADSTVITVPEDTAIGEE